MTEPVLRVLFVCTGNICRSPTAEGVARALAARRGLGARFEVDSAGTHGYHLGEAPDPRTIEAARRRGIDLGGLRARKVEAADFDRFDLIVAMDRGHLDLLDRCCPPARRERVRLFGSFVPGPAPRDVPDPYYGGAEGFDHVLDLIEAGCTGLLTTVFGPEQRVDP
jgi:protein-tyrosine phosphatase